MTMRGPTETVGGALAGERILAVEDSYIVLLEIATVLSNEGAAVTKCATIEEALRAIDTEPFAAAVLDIRLGHETIAPVARRLADLGTPFIFYTGQVLSEATAQWSGIRIVSKPALAAVLVNAVAALLRSSAAARAQGR